MQASARTGTLRFVCHILSGGIEGERPHIERTPQQPRQLEQTQPLQGRAEGTRSLQGPTTVDSSEQLQPQQESRERQPLPNVWDYLERKVRLYAPDVEDRPQRGSEEYMREVEDVNRLSRELDERGTPRAKLIRDLYGEVRCEPAPFPNPVRLRDLSLEEFQQFRSKVEPMTEEQIAKEIRKAEEEFDRKSDELFGEGGGFPSPNSTVRV